ncbi:MAG: LacI family DNA-binding transcriptional regulator [Thermomicrobiales bacterium]
MAQIQIKDVARLAEVSSATVSRVLNNDRGVSDGRRQRVVEAIRELGYQPNRVARSLRRQYTDTIGVVVSDIENPHFTQAVRVVEDAAFERGYRVLLCNTDETPAKQSSYLEMLAAERVLGVVIAPADPADVTISHLLDLDIPIVAFDREALDPRADAVTADNVAAGRRATEHLLERGHTCIGFVAGRPDIQTGIDRLRGFELAMEHRGLPAHSVIGMFRMHEAQMATQQLLAAHPELTALVVGNNLMTVGTLRALKAAGRRVPAEISLVQIDDPFWAELVEPPLTSLAQPVRQMAQAAADLLLQRISRERTVSKHIVFQFELQERASCAQLKPFEPSETNA